MKLIVTGLQLMIDFIANQSANQSLIHSVYEMSQYIKSAHNSFSKSTTQRETEKLEIWHEELFDYQNSWRLFFCRSIIIWQYLTKCQYETVS